MKYNKSDSDSIQITVDCMKKGEIAILPTDTVYGFSGIVDLKGSESYKTDYRIRAVKGRSETKPLIQLISKPEDLYKYTDDKIPCSLLKKWPGALTIIVSVKKDSPLFEFQSTVAFRCPGDEWIRNVIEKTEAPIYSTSVNRSGSPVLDEVNLIEKEFSKEVDLIIDDGDKKGAVPSTIVSISNGEVKIIRQGAVII